MSVWPRSSPADRWNPAEGLYNLTPMLWGTFFAMTGSVLLATPLGVLSAVFCQFYAPPALARIYRRLIELLAGIPSVVYGFWGLVTLVPLIGRVHPPGPSLLAGILILTIMILPTIALMARFRPGRRPSTLPGGGRRAGLIALGNDPRRGFSRRSVGPVHRRHPRNRPGHWRDDGDPHGLRQCRADSA